MKLTWNDRAMGLFLGLAVGDALGTTLEFGPRIKIENLHTGMTGGGPFRLKPGQWTDDTSMALALADSLIEHADLNPLDVLGKWLAWYRNGDYSCTGECFDIGITVSRALGQFERNPAHLPRIDDEALGNGSLMRLAPVAMVSKDIDVVRSLAERQAQLTHGRRAVIATVELAEILFHGLEGSFDQSQIPQNIRRLRRAEVKSSGFYRDTFEAALWSIAQTDDFESAVVCAVNLGDDADTVGAVTGQIAGALYGAASIPERWLSVLAWRERLEETARALTALDIGPM